MQIYLIRHGIAASYSTWEKADAERPLTEKGHTKTKLIADGCSQLGVELTHIYTSPLVRARQTAEIFHRNLNKCEFKETDLLAGEFDALRIVKLLNKHENDAAIALVGHAPYMDILISYLLGHTKKSFTEFKKAAVAMLDCYAPAESGSFIITLVFGTKSTCSTRFETKWKENSLLIFRKPIQIIFLLSCFSIYQNVSAQTKRSSSISERFGADVSHVVQGTSHLITNPLRWHSGDWLRLGAILSGTFVLSLLDEDVHDFFLRNRSHSGDRLADVGTEYGEPRTVFLVTSSVYTLGLLRNNEELRETAVLISTSLICIPSVIPPLY